MMYSIVYSSVQCTVGYWLGCGVQCTYAGTVSCKERSYVKVYSQVLCSVYCTVCSVVNGALYSNKLGKVSNIVLYTLREKVNFASYLASVYSKVYS